MCIKQVVLQLQAVAEMGLDRGGMQLQTEVAMAASDRRQWRLQLSSDGVFKREAMAAA